VSTIDEISYKLGKLQEGIRELQRDIEELKKKTDSNVYMDYFEPSLYNSFWVDIPFNPTNSWEVR